MNLHQTIKELQERNKIKFAKHLNRPDEAVALYEQVNQLTTDTAHAVALAVIGEMRDKMPRSVATVGDEIKSNPEKTRLNAELAGWNSACNKFEAHLTTLEQALQDNK